MGTWLPPKHVENRNKHTWKLVRQVGLFTKIIPECTVNKTQNSSHRVFGLLSPAVRWDANFLPIPYPWWRRSLLRRDGGKYFICQRFVFTAWNKWPPFKCGAVWRRWEIAWDLFLPICGLKRRGFTRLQQTTRPNYRVTQKLLHARYVICSL